MKSLKCKNPDCNEQRMVNNKTGAYFTYCETHQREYWRTKSSAKQPGKNFAMHHPVLNDSAGDNGTSIEREHAKTSRLSEAEKQAIIDRVRERVLSKPIHVQSVPQPKHDHQVFMDTVAALPDRPEKRQIVVNEGVAAPADPCADCVYHDAVDILEKYVPGVRELITGLKAIRK